MDFVLTRNRGSTRSALARRRGGDRFESRLNTAKDVKNGSYCYHVKCATFIVRVGGMPWHKTGATHYHAQL